MLTRLAVLVAITLHAPLVLWSQAPVVAHDSDVPQSQCR